MSNKHNNKKHNHNKNNNQNKNQQNNQNQKKFKVHEDVKKLAEMNFKKFKKKNDYYDSKKELKKAYYLQQLDYLGEAILFVVRWGHLEQNKELKDAIYDKLMDEKLIKVLTKCVKEKDNIDNIELLPNIIADIVRTALKFKAEQKEEGTTAEIDLTDIMELSKLILKKKLKKLVKAGVPEDVAFDVLSVIPTSKILEKVPYYHLRMLFSTVYEHSKEKELDFGKIVKHVIDEDKLTGLITFALLERKDKISSLNEKQIDMYNRITEYCFKAMEKMDKDEVKIIIGGYIASRDRDSKQNKDANRRSYISSLPEADYPKILKVVNKILKDKPEFKKYL